MSSSRVILNVYDLHEMNDQLHTLGLGLYHSGVQVGGLEWTFAGGAGIFSDDPKGAPAKYRESFDMGEFAGSSRDMDIILDDLRQKFVANSYNLLTQNCNSFAEDFCQRLLGKSIPGFVNRMAYMGSLVQCILPPSMTGGDDPTQSGGGSGGSSSSGGSQYGGNRKNPLQQQQPSFGGKASRLGGGGGDTELRPMAIGSAAMSSEQKEAARKARLSAFSSR